MAYRVDVIVFDPYTDDRSSDYLVGRFVPEEDGDWHTLFADTFIFGELLYEKVFDCLPEEEKDFFWTRDLDDKTNLLRSLKER